ncbi:MAG: 3-methyladenine DNA glycosylase [Bacteroidetes bacterium SW_9_63_38]|nr:MAG: 3-methyladenine DNA glycosylase [Bacteroidetes bacterium SW_9_63_38]
MDSCSPSFFRRDTVTVARALLGARLVRDPENTPRRVGRIVETEAYTQDDPAFHGWNLYDEETGTVRREGRAGDLFAESGRGYVYLIYGMHWLLNVVTEPEGTGGAVLVRAVAPVEGTETMRARRGASHRDVNLTNGPGKLSEAFDVDDAFHGEMLTGSPLYLVKGEIDADETIATSSRIGLSRGVDRPWRFFIEGHPYVSPATPSDQTQ